MAAYQQCTPIQVSGRTVAFLRGPVLDVRRRQDGLIRLPSPSLALAVSSLVQARALGCRSIQLTVAGGGTFRISLADFLANGFDVKRAKFERQVGCSLSKFTTDLHLRSEASR